MSTHKYTYGGYMGYRPQLSNMGNSYYGLTNKCIPRTIAITDNTKFNVGTLTRVYVDMSSPNMGWNPRSMGSNLEEPNCNKLTNHSDPKDIKAFDKNKEICLNDETKLEPPSCKTCSVENIM